MKIEDKSEVVVTMKREELLALRVLLGRSSTNSLKDLGVDSPHLEHLDTVFWGLENFFGDEGEG